MAQNQGQTREELNGPSLGGVPAGVPADQPSAQQLKEEEQMMEGLSGAPSLGEEEPAGLPSATAQGCDGCHPRETIWTAATYYEPTRRKTSFIYQDVFHLRCAEWLHYNWYDNHPYTGTLEVYSLGAYVNKPGQHGSGSAFDLTRLRAEHPPGSLRQVFDAVVDEWWGKQYHYYWAKVYWGTVLSLCVRFDPVLTYAYNREHRNHVHFDRSEVHPRVLTRFDPVDDVAQVTNVQGALYYVWGYRGGQSITGSWNPVTEANCAKVMRRIGRGGNITSSQENWIAFCEWTMKQASGMVRL